jgi:hypothetical protein
MLQSIGFTEQEKGLLLEILEYKIACTEWLKFTERKGVFHIKFDEKAIVEVRDVIERVISGIGIGGGQLTETGIVLEGLMEKFGPVCA